MWYGEIQIDIPSAMWGGGLALIVAGFLVAAMVLFTTRRK
jgi:hypothetical protein